MASVRSKAQVVIQTLETILNEKPKWALSLKTYPCQIENIIVYGLEIPLEYHLQLTWHSAERYLCALSQIPYQIPNDEPDRNLFGLLHIGPPTNIILIRQNLPDSIRCYVLAHELGHFLADIYIVQKMWERSMLSQQEAIKRAFLWQESDDEIDLQAFLKGLPPRPRPIVNRGQHERPETYERELLADAIALEIMLPWESACDLYKHYVQLESFVEYAHNFYLLPRHIASQYHSELERFFAPKLDLLTRLFSPAPKRNS